MCLVFNSGSNLLGTRTCVCVCVDTATSMAPDGTALIVGGPRVNTPVGDRGHPHHPPVSQQVHIPQFVLQMRNLLLEAERFLLHSSQLGLRCFRHSPRGRSVRPGGCELLIHTLYPLLCKDKASP